LQSIEGILASILTTLPTPNDYDSIQTQTHPDIYSDQSLSVQSMQTLAESFERATGATNVTWQDKAVGTESVTWQDKAVGTESVTWQDKAVGTASITSESRDKEAHTASNTRDIGILLSDSGAVGGSLWSAVAKRLSGAAGLIVAEHLQSAVAKHLPKAGAVAEHLQKGPVWLMTVLAAAVLSALLYCFCNYTLQQDAVLPY
jgi:hypothetical protein